MTREIDYETGEGREYLIEVDVKWTILDGMEIEEYRFLPIRRNKLIDKQIQIEHPDYDEMYNAVQQWFIENAHELEIEYRTSEQGEPEYYEYGNN